MKQNENTPQANPPPVELVIPNNAENVSGTQNSVKNNISSNPTNSLETNIQVCVRMRPLLVVPSSSSSGIKTPIMNNLRSLKKSKSILRASRFQKPTASSRSKLPKPSGNSSSKNNNQNDYAWEVPSNSNSIQQAEWTNPDPSRKSSYAFDKVFSPSSATSSIYESSIRPIVHATVDGYHGSVFAYGQTSTGKTYTMHGTKQELGVVPLAVEDIFRYITSRNADTNSNREFLLRVSYMEIYNEQINDLLAAPTNTSHVKHRRLGTQPYVSQVRIFENKNDGVVIRGLKEEVVTNPQQVYQLIATGEANRHTGSTNLNKHSSRSHSIFRIIIESRTKHVTKTLNSKNNDKNNDIESLSSAGSELNKPVRVSSLSLVDLAGSESVKATGTSGQRLKEGQYINKSLMTLGHVIFKLSERAEGSNQSKVGTFYQHIPYRDSKLTRLMQTSLSGNAQICIICNISPSLRNIEETHNTLKFASRAKRIKQVATVNEVTDDRTLLQNYREEIEFLKKQLKEAHEVKKESEPKIETNSDVDAKTLVKAIKNLETLILSQGKSIDSPVVLDEVSLQDTDSRGAESIDDEESLLDDSRTAISVDSDDLTATKKILFLDKKGKSLKKKKNKSPNREKKNSALFRELHRIQNLLGSVLNKSQKSKNASTPSSIPTNNEVKPEDPTDFMSPERDKEMESLRLRLKKQEMATSMRKADSSFLEGQLAEKER